MPVGTVERVWDNRGDGQESIGVKLSSEEKSYKCWDKGAFKLLVVGNDISYSLKTSTKGYVNIVGVGPADEPVAAPAPKPTAPSQAAPQAPKISDGELRREQGLAKGNSISAAATAIAAHIAATKGKTPSDDEISLIATAINKLSLEILSGRTGRPPLVDAAVQAGGVIVEKPEDAPDEPAEDAPDTEQDDI